MLAYFSKASFVGLVSTLVGRQLDPATVTLQNSVVPAAGFGTKREVQHTVNIPTADGTGRMDVVVYYNRLPLSYLNDIPLNRNGLTNEDTTVHKLLGILHRDMGIDFTTYDLEDDPVTAQSSLTNFQLTLRAKAGSPRFKGQCTITVGRKATTASLFTNSDLGSV